MSEFPASGANGPQGATSYGSQAPPDATSPQYYDRPVAVRGPESLGGLLLILAGIAAAVSLLLDWLRDDDVSGWGLLRNAFDALGDAFSSGLWQPLAILLGGGVLFVLGLLMWLPARSHRFLGVLALLVSAAVIAGVLVPLADADWDLGFFGPGFWCAIAVAVLGLLGSLKALLSRPKTR
ncbi:hypothetical protein [Blastococcus sp. CT_GayMR16]|uniref:hypothetical protein n=1 Tax=Blastococcus sp. CT_GayMR16 TaxID=2559607 RepID=UPI001ADDE607|nr:hypothetical protein [Blastococcus sp. CT_GayMR16]